MDLSIIIPSHNEENNITPLLWSLRNQLFENYEVELIFVLDKNEDNTEEIIKNFDFDNKYTIKIIKSNYGYCGLARNKGVQNSTGKYIWFVDADDWIIDSLAIQIILNVFNKQNCLALHFNYAVPQDCPLKELSMTMWQYVFKREVIEEIPFIKIKPHEDVIFWRKFLKKYNYELINYINVTFYYYNFHESDFPDRSFLIFNDKKFSLEKAQELEKQKIAPWDDD